jgi:hypothetical protein
MTKTTPLIPMLLMAAVLGISSGCAATGGSVDKAGASAAIEAAETERNKAASVDGEWRDVGEIIKQAKAAADEGDFANAEKLANKARSQSEMGYQQAIEQASVAKPGYL